MIIRTLTRGSAMLVHAEISSLVARSGYLFRAKVASSSCSCWLVNCVLCLRGRRLSSLSPRPVDEEAGLVVVVPEVVPPAPPLLEVGTVEERSEAFKDTTVDFSEPEVILVLLLLVRSSDLSVPGLCEDPEWVALECCEMAGLW